MGTRDPDSTKRRILDAALREFSDKGIAGARVDAIATRAGVNKRMLYYYYGSKEALFREILQRRVDEGSAAFRAAEVAAPGRLARRQADIARQQDYVRLLGWEGLEASPGAVVDESLRRAYFEHWIKAVEEEQQAGNLPADLDAAQLVLSEVCLVLGPLLLPQLTQLITGCESTSSRQLDRRATFFDALERRLSC